jgi:hypothetical protein
MNQHSINDPVLLIGGTGRSGTTIFRKLMERHPDVATVPEWRFLTDPGGIVEYLTVLKQGNPYMCDQAYRRLCRLLKDVAQPAFLSRIVNRFSKLQSHSPCRLTWRYSTMTAERELPGFSLMMDKLLHSLVDFHWYGQYAGLQFGQSRQIAGILSDAGSAESAFREFLGEIATMAMQRHNRSRFLEKNTWSLLHFDIISRLYPSGKLVHIHRDPRDVVASYTKQIWMPSDPVQSAHLLKRLFDLWWQARGQVDGSRWMEIGLQELVDDTENVLRHVCKFWEIEFDPCLLSVDLSRSNSGRWKKDLTLDDQKKVENILGEIVEYYGY